MSDYITNMAPANQHAHEVMFTPTQFFLIVLSCFFFFNLVSSYSKLTFNLICAHILFVSFNQLNFLMPLFLDLPRWSSNVKPTIIYISITDIKM